MNTCRHTMSFMFITFTMLAIVDEAGRLDQCLPCALTSKPPLKQKPWAGTTERQWGQQTTSHRMFLTLYLYAWHVALKMRDAPQPQPPAGSSAMLFPSGMPQPLPSQRLPSAISTLLRLCCPAPAPGHASCPLLAPSPAAAESRSAPGTSQPRPRPSSPAI